MWFEAVIIRSGFLQQYFQQCSVAVLLTDLGSSSCILFVDLDVLALVGLRKTGDVMLCLAVYRLSWS